MPGSSKNSNIFGVPGSPGQAPTAIQQLSAADIPGVWQRKPAIEKLKRQAEEDKFKAIYKKEAKTRHATDAAFHNLLETFVDRKDLPAKENVEPAQALWEDMTEKERSEYGK